MKPFEIKPVIVTTPKAEMADVGHEAGSELAQRLWQLLMPLPEASEAGATTLNAAAIDNPRGTGSTQGHRREAWDRDRDGTSELTSTAHVLAAAVHQLGLITYTHQTEAAEQQAAARQPHQGWQLQLGHVDANGGTASLEVAHPHLGDITLEVELSNGVLHVIASAPHEHAAKVLLEGQAQLAERLQRQGVKLKSLDVVVANKRKDSQRARARNRKQER